MLKAILLFLLRLFSRLLERTGAVPLLVFARRLSWGRGFRLYIEPLPVTPEATLESLGRSASQAMSALIRRHPEPYLWSYRLWHRHADVPPPPEDLSPEDAGPPKLPCPLGGRNSRCEFQGRA